MENKIVVSPLGKTWVFDLDGTIVKHNGYKIDGQDTLLPGAKEFFDQLPKEDLVLIVTARKREFAAETEGFLHQNGIRFHTIIYDAPFGERVLINDKKPSGLEMALAVNTVRDQFCTVDFQIDEQL